MLTFRTFLENEEEKNLQQMLGKLPQSHRSLVKGFDFKFHSGNTLDGDDEHVGYMDDKGKEIGVAAPWNYGREFTILHEIGHRVWERLPDQIKKAWFKIVQQTKRTKKEQHQNDEELFSMAYAATYSKHPPTTFAIPTWIQFIKNLP
jgi:hypothetical protein